METEQPSRKVGRPPGRARRGAGWKQEKAKSKRPRHSGPGDSYKHTPVCAEPTSVLKSSELVALPLTHPPVRQVLEELWSGDYREFYLREMLIYESNGMLQQAAGLFDLAPASTYIRNNRAPEANRIKRMGKETLTIVTHCAEATHMRNALVMPFSMIAGSIATLATKATTRQWVDQDILVSKKTAIEYVKQMKSVRPGADFDESLRVFLFVYDQVHRVADCDAKKGKSTALERIQGNGLAATWKQDTYVNIIHIPLPRTLLNLTQEDLTELRDKGPMPNTFDAGKAMLRTEAVRIDSQI